MPSKAVKRAPAWRLCSSRFRPAVPDRNTNRLEMTEHDLSLRPIGDNDYAVVRESRAIGRLRMADQRPDHEMWEWAINPPLPVPSWGVGRAPSFEEAKSAFREAWVKFYAQLKPADIEHWHRHQDTARERE
jgi:hypothetical protein